MNSVPTLHKIRFIKREKIAKYTYSFYFARPKNFSFSAGQYIRIILPHTKDRHTSRFFTISSSPEDREYMVIVLQKGKTEFKKSLFAIQPGEHIECFGPNGGLYFDEKDTSPRVFLAGGLGLVSFYAMICYIAEKQIPIPVTLIASFSRKEDIFYYTELITIAQHNSQIKVIFTLTREQWSYQQGRISPELIKKYVADIAKPTYSVVGFPDMVTDVEEMLEQMGVPLSHIRTEAFVGY